MMLLVERRWVDLSRLVARHPVETRTAAAANHLKELNQAALKTQYTSAKAASITALTVSASNACQIQTARMVTFATILSELAQSANQTTIAKIQNFQPVAILAFATPATPEKLATV